MNSQHKSLQSHAQKYLRRGLAPSGSKQSIHEEFQKFENQRGFRANNDNKYTKNLVKRLDSSSSSSSSEDTPKKKDLDLNNKNQVQNNQYRATSATDAPEQFGKTENKLLNKYQKEFVKTEDKKGEQRRNQFKNASSGSDDSDLDDPAFNMRQSILQHSLHGKSEEAYGKLEDTEIQDLKAQMDGFTDNCAGVEEIQDQRGANKQSEVPVREGKRVQKRDDSIYICNTNQSPIKYDALSRNIGNQQQTSQTTQQFNNTGKMTHRSSKQPSSLKNPQQTPSFHEDNQERQQVAKISNGIQIQKELDEQFVILMLQVEERYQQNLEKKYRRQVELWSKVLCQIIQPQGKDIEHLIQIRRNRNLHAVKLLDQILSMKELSQEFLCIPPKYIQDLEQLDAQETERGVSQRFQSAVKDLNPFGGSEFDKEPGPSQLSTIQPKSEKNLIPPSQQINSQNNHQKPPQTTHKKDQTQTLSLHPPDLHTSQKKNTIPSIGGLSKLKQSKSPRLPSASDTKPGTSLTNISLQMIPTKLSSTKTGRAASSMSSRAKESEKPQKRNSAAQENEAADLSHEQNQTKASMVYLEGQMTQLHQTIQHQRVQIENLESFIQKKQVQGQEYKQQIKELTQQLAEKEQEHQKLYASHAKDQKFQEKQDREAKLREALVLKQTDIIDNITRQLHKAADDKLQLKEQLDESIQREEEMKRIETDLKRKIDKVEAEARERRGVSEGYEEALRQVERLDELLEIRERDLKKKSEENKDLEREKQALKQKNLKYQELSEKLLQQLEERDCEEEESKDRRVNLVRTELEEEHQQAMQDLEEQHKRQMKELEEQIVDDFTKQLQKKDDEIFQMRDDYIKNNDELKRKDSQIFHLERRIQELMNTQAVNVSNQHKGVQKQDQIHLNVSDDQTGNHQNHQQNQKFVNQQINQTIPQQLPPQDLTKSELIIQRCENYIKKTNRGKSTHRMEPDTQNQHNQNQINQSTSNQIQRDAYNTHNNQLSNQHQISLEHQDNAIFHQASMVQPPNQSLMIRQSSSELQEDRFINIEYHQQSQLQPAPLQQNQLNQQQQQYTIPKKMNIQVQQNHVHNIDRNSHRSQNSRGSSTGPNKLNRTDIELYQRNDPTNQVHLSCTNQQMGRPNPRSSSQNNKQSFQQQPGTQVSALQNQNSGNIHQQQFASSQIENKPVSSSQVLIGALQAMNSKEKGQNQAGPNNVPSLNHHNLSLLNAQESSYVPLKTQNIQPKSTRSSNQAYDDSGRHGVKDLIGGGGAISGISQVASSVNVSQLNPNLSIHKSVQGLPSGLPPKALQMTNISQVFVNSNINYQQNNQNTTASHNQQKTLKEMYNSMTSQHNNRQEDSNSAVNHTNQTITHPPHQASRIQLAQHALEDTSNFEKTMPSPPKPHHSHQEPSTDLPVAQSLQLPNNIHGEHTQKLMRDIRGVGQRREDGRQGTMMIEDGAGCGDDDGGRGGQFVGGDESDQGCRSMYGPITATQSVYTSQNNMMSATMVQQQVENAIGEDEGNQHRQQHQKRYSQFEQRQDIQTYRTLCQEGDNENDEGNTEIIQEGHGDTNGYQVPQNHPYDYNDQAVNQNNNQYQTQESSEYFESFQNPSFKLQVPMPPGTSQNIQAQNGRSNIKETKQRVEHKRQGFQLNLGQVNQSDYAHQPTGSYTNNGGQSTARGSYQQFQGARQLSSRLQSNRKEEQNNSYSFNNANYQNERIPSNSALGTNEGIRSNDRYDKLYDELIQEEDLVNEHQTEKYQAGVTYHQIQERNGLEKDSVGQDKNQQRQDHINKSSEKYLEQNAQRQGSYRQNDTYGIDNNQYQNQDKKQTYQTHDVSREESRQKSQKPPSSPSIIDQSADIDIQNHLIAIQQRHDQVEAAEMMSDSDFASSRHMTSMASAKNFNTNSVTQTNRKINRRGEESTASRHLRLIQNRYAKQSANILDDNDQFEQIIDEEDDHDVQSSSRDSYAYKNQAKKMDYGEENNQNYDNQDQHIQFNQLQNQRNYVPTNSLDDEDEDEDLFKLSQFLTKRGNQNSIDQTTRQTVNNSQTSHKTASASARGGAPISMRNIENQNAQDAYGCLQSQGPVHLPPHHIPGNPSSFHNQVPPSQPSSSSNRPSQIQMTESMMQSKLRPSHGQRRGAAVGDKSPFYCPDTVDKKFDKFVDDLL